MNSIAFKDLIAGFTGYRTWLYLAWLGIKRRYATSMIGPNWTLITNTFFIVAVSLLFSGLNSKEFMEFSAFLAFGYLLWTYLVSFVVAGNQVFLIERANISNGSSNLTGLALKFTFTQLLIFAHSIPILVVTWFTAGGSPIGALYSLGAFILITINMFLFLVWGGTICARYRDISILIETIMRLGFFMTPILWHPDNAGSGIKSIFVMWNPFHYLTTIFRDTAVYGQIELIPWIVVGAMTVINLIMAWFFLKLAKRQLVYWIQ